MSGIVDEVTRLEATRGPALRLVDHKWSGFVLGCLRLSFGSHGGAVPAARLHAQVDTYLEELVDAGREVPPNMNGRSLCLSWVREAWLARLPGDDGEEVYERTSHALSAERVVSALGRERSMLNESRLRTIVDAVHRWALEAEPDVTSRMTDLDHQISALTAERERLASGGELPRAEGERMRHGYADVLDLLEQLPSDFRRVEESLDTLHRTMIYEFRTEERPQGEVLGSYLDAANELMTATPAGRAFEGALGILGDEERLASFKDDLRAIMAHPFAQELDARSRREFMDAAGLLRRGLQDVQVRQHQASRSLAEYLTQAQVDQERELTTVLHRVQSELSVWSQTAKGQDRIQVMGTPAKAAFGHLRRRFDALVPAAGAKPLEDVSSSAPLTPEIDSVRRSGGPLLSEVMEALVALAPSPQTSLPEAFNALPEDLRRPVELFGLMQLVTDQGLLGEGNEDAGPKATVHTVRPDGTTRNLRMPAPLLGQALAHDNTVGDSQGTTQGRESK